jgi:hypothetical protein
MNDTTETLPAAPVDDVRARNNLKRSRMGWWPLCDPVRSLPAAR